MKPWSWMWFPFSIKHIPRHPIHPNWPAYSVSSFGRPRAFNTLHSRTNNALCLQHGLLTQITTCMVLCELSEGTGCLSWTRVGTPLLPSPLFHGRRCRRRRRCVAVANSRVCIPPSLSPSLPLRIEHRGIEHLPPTFSRVWTVVQEG